MSDLVERLRTAAQVHASFPFCREAADEIARLRAALDRLSNIEPYETLETVRAFARQELEGDK